jgi:hypothetical protein
MELDELRSAWISNNEKLEKKIRINEAQIELIQKQRIASKLAPLFWQRIVEMAFHAVFIVLLLVFLFQHIGQPPYAISAIALLGFYSLLFINALNLARIVRNIDYNQDLGALQRALTLLQTRFMNYAKMTVLFIPVFLSYPVVVSKVIQDYHINALAEFDVIAKSNGSWWTMQLVVLCVMTPLGIWFYREVNYRNMHKKWVRDFIRKSSGKRVEKAMAFLNELQHLKQDAQ